ncbi:MAG: hypothetical protein ACLRQ0_05480 [Monoglobales bacterium]
MEKLEIKDNFINIYENDELIYSFDWERLSEIWDYATLDDVEEISADYVEGLMSVILTTAEGQGGIVAVVDTANDEIIHYHDGSFAVKTMTAGDRLITLYHAMCYGALPTYYVDCMYINHMEMTEADDNIKLPDSTEFNDEEIALTLAERKLTIQDGTNIMNIDISTLL